MKRLYLEIEALASLSMSDSYNDRIVTTRRSPSVTHILGLLENALGYHVGWGRRATLLGIPKNSSGYRKRRVSYQPLIDVSVVSVQGFVGDTFLDLEQYVTYQEGPRERSKTTRMRHRYLGSVHAELESSALSSTATTLMPYYAPTIRYRERIDCIGETIKVVVDIDDALVDSIIDAIDSPCGILYLGDSDGWVDLRVQQIEDCEAESSNTEEVKEEGTIDLHSLSGRLSIYERYALAVCLFEHDCGSEGVVPQTDLVEWLVDSIESHLGFSVLQTNDPENVVRNYQFRLPESMNKPTRAVPLPHYLVGGRSLTGELKKALLKAQKIKGGRDQQSISSTHFPVFVKRNRANAPSRAEAGVSKLEWLLLLFAGVLRKKPAIQWQAGPSYQRAVLFPDLSLYDLMLFVEVFEYLYREPEMQAKGKAWPSGVDANFSLITRDVIQETQAASLIVAVGLWAREAEAAPWAKELVTKLATARVYTISTSTTTYSVFQGSYRLADLVLHTPDLKGLLWQVIREDSEVGVEGKSLTANERDRIKKRQRQTAIHVARLLQRMDYATLLALTGHLRQTTLPHNFHFITDVIMDTIPSEVYQAARAFAQSIRGAAAKAAIKENDEFDYDKFNALLIRVDTGILSASSNIELLQKATIEVGRSGSMTAYTHAAQPFLNAILVDGMKLNQAKALLSTLLKMKKES